MRAKLHLILLLVCCSVAWAETNAAPTDAETLAEPAMASVEEMKAQADAAGKSLPAEEVSERPSTHIYSDTVELAIKSRSAVYRGNVRLDDPRIQLTCEQLSADVPEAGGRVDQVVAETNVVIVVLDDEGRTNRAYADKAVYRYVVADSVTNEVVELSGDSQPRIERPEGTLYGDVIVWDRSGNRIRATNQRMIYRADPETVKSILSGAGTRPPTGGARTPESDSPPENRSELENEATHE